LKEVIMEYSSKPVNKRYSSYRGRNKDMDFGVFESLITKYAQEDMTQLDPTQVQVGQPVYNRDGTEFVIIEDEEGTPDKVIMPADQKGKEVPEGVVTVNDSELSTSYSIQNPTGGPGGPVGPQTAHADTSEFLSGLKEAFVLPEFRKAINYKPTHTIKEPYSKEDVSSADDWMRMKDDSKTNIDNWHKMDKNKSKFKANNMCILPEFKSFKLSLQDKQAHFDTVKSTQEISEYTNEVNNKFKSEFKDVHSALKEDDEFRIGESGYVEAIDSIQNMLDAGYQIVDVILNLGEMYPRETATRILEEARKKGIL